MINLLICALYHTFCLLHIKIKFVLIHLWQKTVQQLLIDSSHKYYWGDEWKKLLENKNARAFGIRAQALNSF
jgi:hypothetical protein